MAVRGILFDFDGTLANTTPLILATFHQTLDHFVPERKVEDQAIINTFGLPLREGLAGLAGCTDPAELDRMTAYYRQYNTAWHDEMIRPFPGVKEGLTALRRAGVPMAIVTSKFKASCQRGLRCLGLEDCIDGIIGCQECTAHKPDPEPMEKGLELLGLRGEECLCVGDSPYDLVSGKKAGCRTVKVGWTSFSQDFFDRFIRPDYTIGTLKDLLSFVEPSKPER